MNSKTAKRLRRWSLDSEHNYNISKKLWKNTPRNKLTQLKETLFGVTTPEEWSNPIPKKVKA